MKRVTATVTTEVVLTVEILAAAFTEMSDDEQARFFTEVARVADSTYTDGLMRSPTLNAEFQWSAVGRHLRECKCATDRGREMVRAIYESMTEARAPGGHHG